MNPTLLGFIKKEFIQVLRDKRMRLMIFGVPVIQITLFGIALSTEVKNIRLGAVYQPKDSVMRQVEEHSLASGWFIPARTQDPDPFHWVQSGTADVVLVAPPEGLTEAIERRNPQIQLLINATNVVFAQRAEAYVQSILNTVLVDQRLSVAPPPRIAFNVRVLYNPAMETSMFMVPGVMCLILCVVTIILTSMSIAKEKEVGTFETLISAPISTAEILMGKTLPYVVLGIMDVPLILAVAYFFFGVPMKGSLIVLMLATLMFVITAVSIGTLISTIARNQQQAMMGGFLFLFPAIQLSGIMFPLENMPTWMLIIAYLNPLNYFVILLRNILLKGGESSVVLSHVAILFLVAVGSTWLSFKRFRHTLQ